MTRITGAWLERPETQDLFRMLGDNGAAAYFVGGCVRNALLKEQVNDIDIATDAVPTQVLEWAKAAGLKAIPTGIEHGTVTVVSRGVPYEITTFRRDVATDGRRAVVAFTKNLTEDARRRDFTMNALYARADGTVVDPLAGMADLQARRVRFIEDAGQRIAEDYLRILRFFRFSAWYGDPALGFDADALAAISDNLDGLGTLSKERVGAEMLKLLGAPDPVRSVATMRSLGVLTRVLSGADDRALGPLVHLELLSNTAAYGLRRLAALGGETPDTDLRLSKKQAQKTMAMRTAAVSSNGPAELGYRYGFNVSVSAILLRSALLETYFSSNLLIQAQHGAAATFPVKAADLMPAYVGVDLGQCLTALEDRWIASSFSLSKADLLSDI